MKPFSSVWQALKFYAIYELNNGMEVLIPCLMPDPGYTGVTSYRPPIIDERIGEPAAVFFRIKNSLEVIKKNGLLSETEIQFGLGWARGQVRADAIGMSQTLTRKQVDKMNRDVERLSNVLLPFLRKREVVE